MTGRSTALPPDDHGVPTTSSRSGDSTDAAQEQETTATKSFALFLETMKAPQAADLVRSIRTFIRTFESQQPRASSHRARVNTHTTAVQENNGVLVGEFLDKMENTMAGHVLFGGGTGEKAARARKTEDGVEGLEKYVMSKLYAMTFQVAVDDLDKDDRCHRLCNALSFLDVNTVIGSKTVHDEEEREEMGKDGEEPGDRKLDDFCVTILDDHIEKAQLHLLAMDKYKAPRDKLVCLMNVQLSLEEGIRRVNACDTSLSFAGADAFFPMLVLVVIRARPSALSSNIEYIRRFRGSRRLGGKCDFMLSCLESVVLYLDTVNWEDLRIGREAWMDRLREAGIPEASLHLAADGERTGAAIAPVPGVDARGQEPSAGGEGTHDAQATDDAVVSLVKATESAEANPEVAFPTDSTENGTSNARAELIASLIEEGTPLVLHEESEGLLQEKYPWIYADAGDVREEQVVDQLLSAYRDLVVKHEALKLAIEKGEGRLKSECRNPTHPESGSASSRMPLVTDLMQKMSTYAGSWNKVDPSAGRPVGERATTAPHLLSAFFGGAKSTAPPSLSPVTASVSARATRTGSGISDE